jgi:hypothetical protein
LPYGGAPAGYSPYGQNVYGAQPGQPGNSGMAITGFVLALVGLVPCFWFWFLQVPGYLGIIFSSIGLRATKGGARRGRGLAIAGLIISLLVVAIALLVTLFIYTSSDCVNNGISFDCKF